MAEKLLKAKKKKIVPSDTRAASMRPPREIVLVGTYKERQLAWIKKYGVYNYPVKDGDEFDAESFAKIKELWLYADAKGRRRIRREQRRVHHPSPQSGAAVERDPCQQRVDRRAFISCGKCSVFDKMTFSPLSFAAVFSKILISEISTNSINGQRNPDRGRVCASR